MEEVDYYAILEVDRSANSDAIKKSYRKLALRWHPDKNPDNKEEAEKRFKLVSEAYEVLSDPRKRQIYDLHGKEGLSSGVPGPSDFSGFDDIFHFHDPFEIFAQVFGSSIFDILGSPFPHGNSHGHRTRAHRRHNPYEQGRRHTVRPADTFDLFSGIGFGGGMFSSVFDDMSGGFGGSSGFSSVSSFSSGGGFGGGMGRSMSSSTRIVNGRVVNTTTVRENNIETITETVDGQVVRTETRPCVNDASSSSIYLGF
ncbi:unnamed protein product [Hymenolepis diminuta]|uniref:J domain-containing protein n=1 Tax=Hymenolepis diminuta TaxID=6216 RepID=A0A0R3SU74_HYMDI|nr:unnamed protein product [Hymenolepis diminuta]VUZ44069.1 unnamed protein product [Hymenolepis diminuta]